MNTENNISNNPSVNPVYPIQNQANPQNTPNSGGSKNLLVIILIIVVIFFLSIVVAGLVFYFLVFKKISNNISKFPINIPTIEMKQRGAKNPLEENRVPPTIQAIITQAANIAQNQLSQVPQHEAKPTVAVLQTVGTSMGDFNAQLESVVSGSNVSTIRFSLVCSNEKNCMFWAKNWKDLSTSFVVDEASSMKY